MSENLAQWEFAERERSAAEASHFDSKHLLADAQNLARYVNPPADTPYQLEYAFHLLGDVRGKTVLEYGCGDGINTILLAQHGAHIKSLDISPELIAIARERLRVNRVDADVEFIVGSAHDVPLPDESVDVVFGIAILHHLDLELAAREVKRVLRKGGKAIFQEPVRNSKLVKAVRGLIPYQSPDVSPFERPLTDEELKEFTEGFSRYHARSFRLPYVGLTELPPLRKFTHPMLRFDSKILRAAPVLDYYATVRVLEMIK